MRGQRGEPAVNIKWRRCWQRKQCCLPVDKIAGMRAASIVTLLNAAVEVHAREARRPGPPSMGDSDRPGDGHALTAGGVPPSEPDRVDGL